MTDPRADNRREDRAVTIPVLALDEAEAFYRDRLRFEVERVGDYLIARRDAMEIHFWLAGERIHPENTSWVRGRSMPPRVSPPTAPRAPGARRRSVPPARPA